MSKTANILLAFFALLFLHITNTHAVDLLEVKYFFSDPFFSGENPLGSDQDPNFTRVKEAMIMACKAWENATGGSIAFVPATGWEDADIIFEGWSENGPDISIQGDRLCLDEYGTGNVFPEYMPEALGFTIFEDCNIDCRFPETHDPADADTGHRARIFFHVKKKSGQTEPWFYITDKNKVQFSEAQRDVIRLAMKGIAYALGFCGHPDEDADTCGKVPECSRNNASILCKEQTRCFQENLNGPVFLGGRDDIDDLGVRDLTFYDKKRVLQKFFPGTKILYGKVKDASGKPISAAVVSLNNGRFSVGTNSSGIYSLWRIKPGNYTVKVHNPENNRMLGESIAIAAEAEDITIKNFNFAKDAQPEVSSSQVTPSSGSPDDIYNFSATFSNIDYEKPATAKLIVDGHKINDFFFPSPAGQKSYIFSYHGLTGLKPGAHYYEFKVSEKGDRRHTLSGSFRVNRPAGIQIAVESRPAILDVGENAHSVIIAELKNNEGVPIPGRNVLFQTNFPGFFTPAGGKIVTDSRGRAEITFTPQSSGKATVTVVSSCGPSASTTVTCTSPPISISFQFRPFENNSYKVTSHIKYFVDKQPVAGEAVKWRLKPSSNVSWIKAPDRKTDKKGRASGIFKVNTSHASRVSVTVTHVLTGASGTGGFVFERDVGKRIVPWKRMGKNVEQCEWSPNGYFAMRWKKGSGLSIYRISNWEKVWAKKRRSGKYRSFSFSSDGKKLAAGIFNGRNQIALLNVPAGSVDKVWDVVVDKEKKDINKSIRWQENEIYTIQSDGGIGKWSISGNHKMNFKQSTDVREFRFNPAIASQFAAVNRYGDLIVWNADSSSPIRTVKVESMPSGKLKCLTWSQDGKYLSVGSGIGKMGMIYTFDTSNWSKSAFDLSGLGDVNSLDYNKDSSLLAIGHDNGLIIYNTATYSIEYYDKDPVKRVRWSPDGSMLAADGRIYVFNGFNFRGPGIQVAIPQSGASYTKDSVEVAGKIFGPHRVRSAVISVNEAQPTTLSLDTDGSFKKTISLTKNRNLILIEAKDILRNTSSFSIPVKHPTDHMPPVLTEPYINAGIGERGTKFDFSIRAYDGDSGVDASKVMAKIKLPDGDTLATVLLYDDGDLGDQYAGDGIFASFWTSSVAGEGLYSVDFQAFDRAGNSVVLNNGVKFFVYDRPRIKKPYLSTTSPRSEDPVKVIADITSTAGVTSAELLYSTNAGRSWNTVPMSSTGSNYAGTIPAQSVGNVYYRIKAHGMNGYTSKTNSYAYTIMDESMPVVRIVHPTQAEDFLTSNPSIIVSGQAVDPSGSGLKSVTCTTGGVNRGTLKEWSFKVPLKKGANTITIVTETHNGKMASDSIEITYAAKLPPPIFSPKAPHISSDPVSVVITSSNKGAAIHYTTDNSEPTKRSPVFSSPILIKGTTTIKARVYKTGWVPSSTAISTYTFKKKEKIPTPKKKAPPKAKTVALSPTLKAKGGWSIQIQSLKNKKFAENLRTDLKKRGYSAYTFVAESPGKSTWYKVRIGPFKNRVKAENIRNGLVDKYKENAVLIVNNAPVLPEKKKTSKSSDE